MKNPFKKGDYWVNNLLKFDTFKMKLSLLLVIFAFFQLQAKDVFSQNEIILDFENTPIVTVFNKIKEQTGYSFFYNLKEVDESRKVDIKVHKINLQGVLGKLSEIANFDYKIFKKQIILTKKKTETSIQEKAEKIERIITGTVKDSNGVPLSGANILVKGTSIGAQANFDGEFTITVPDDQNILVVSFIGYETQEVNIEGLQSVDIILKDDTAALELIVLVGSRAKARVDVDRAVPVDVLEAEDLASTGQTDLGQQIQFTSPSFNSAKYGVNGTTNYAEPATLKGLSPDQSLVLINGKRRHQFSTLNLNVAPGLGTIVTDLNSVPTGAIKRVEVLRDGAAAQYGSDAIAGIINLSLNNSTGKLTYNGTTGIHKEGDGATFKHSFNYGFGLGKEDSFLNFTLETFRFEGTNRSDPYTGTIYPNFEDFNDPEGPWAQDADQPWPYLTENPRADRNVYPQEDFVVGNYGANENDTYQAFYNSAFPISDEWRVYSFGGVSRKDILAYGFFRNPARYSRASLSIFPDGYVPELPGTSFDVSTVVGIDRKTESGWNYDLSYGYGRNYLDLFANNTVNPSLGAASPTEFKVGRYEFRQTIGEFNMFKQIDESLTLAFGSQLRNDNFILHSGSPESYEVGPLAAIGKDVGSSARPGIADVDENDLSRSNFALYADAEKDFSEKFLLTGALRYENYSDFGSNLSGKLATRYKLTDKLALRGSYNRGFRAPSVAQIGNRVNTSTVQNGQIFITKQVSSDDPRLAQLGINDPEAEISNNYNLGFTAKLLEGKLLFTVDAFQIDIDDRIVISERLRTANFPNVAALFPEAREIRFFTNHISTKTTGLDIVTTYKKRFENDSKLDLSLALTFNKTEVQSQKDTPSEILEGAAPEFQDTKLLGAVATELIEVAQPRNKILFSATYDVGKFAFMTRVTNFGEVRASSRGLSLDDPNVIEGAGANNVQIFSAKAITDLSISYSFNSNYKITFGANNIFDVYPDKYNNTADGFVGQASSYASGQIPYSRNSNQFGFNGAYYFMGMNINL